MEEVRQGSEDVLEKDSSWTGLSDDPAHVRPEVAGVVSPSPLASNGEGLTGEASVDKIDSTAPRAAIEGSEIGPDRGTIQPSVLHSPNEDVLAERVRFDVADRPVARDDPPEPESDPFDSGAERERIHLSSPSRASIAARMARALRRKLSVHASL